jgi:Lysozyme like domain
MLRLTPRQLAIAGCVVLLIALVAVVADADAANRARVRAQICQVFGARCSLALAVARCETGGTFDPRAVGSQGERGVFQIHRVHWGWLNEARLFEPTYNAWVAYRLSRGGRDWTHWTCRP